MDAVSKCVDEMERASVAHEDVERSHVRKAMGSVGRICVCLVILIKRNL